MTSELNLSLPPAWTTLANCADTDPDSFFPTTERTATKAAKAVCHRCPVIEQCRTYALENHEEHGVWGGLSAHERTVIIGRHLRTRIAAA